MIRRLLLVWVGCAGIAFGQTHKVAKPEDVVRAVGVYEWTGDMAKPAASRLIPVTVFIDGQMQDAGVYLARPVPFALLSGNYYELQSAGVVKGGLELSYAKHLQLTETATGATAFDDGWFGYGSFKALAVAKKAAALKASTQISEVKGSKGTKATDDGKPQFSKNPTADDAGKEASGSGSKSAEDADRPTMRRRSGSGSGSGSGSSTANDSGKSASASSAGADTSVPADDPDRPHMSKRTSSDASKDPSGDPSGDAGQGGPAKSDGPSAGTTTTAPTPTTASGGDSNDPDRPTLKRRTVEEIKKDRKNQDSASVTGLGSLNDDPNRPTMRRGKPASAMTEEDLPKLLGIPVDLKQMVAVSDAANRPAHDFARPWEDDMERAAVLSKMQVLARAKLAGYGSAASAAAVPATVRASATPAARRAAAAAAKKKSSAPGVPLLEEELKGYLLSYGGLPTYVYTAHTEGTGATLEYVTVVAQSDAFNQLKVAMESVTDAAHMDRTPRMRLVDAVDAEASNRASLLFELRGERSRQFGLYSVIGARAQQLFLSGSTQ
jgi:hypothetical protein